MNPVVHFTIHLFQAWNTVICVSSSTWKTLHSPCYCIYCAVKTTLWRSLILKDRMVWVMWAGGRRRQERHFWNRQQEAEDTGESGNAPSSPWEEVLGTRNRCQLALQAGLFLKEWLALFFLLQGKSKKSMRNSNTLATWCEELTHWKRPWCWERLRAGAEGNDRGWDGWMASPTQWTWVWVDSRSWWWTGRPGVLGFIGSQRVGHNRATEVNWTEPINISRRDVARMTPAKPIHNYQEVKIECS